MPLSGQEESSRSPPFALIYPGRGRGGHAPSCLFSRSGAVFNLLLAAGPRRREISVITRISRGEEGAAVTPGAPDSSSESFLEESHVGDGGSTCRASAHDEQWPLVFLAFASH